MHIVTHTDVGMCRYFQQKHMHIVTHTYIKTPSLCAAPMCMYVISMCWEYLHMVHRSRDIVLLGGDPLRKFIHIHAQSCTYCSV